MRVLVCGGRDFSDVHLMALAMIEHVLRPTGYRPPKVIIHGDARGADRLADEWAKRVGVPTLPFPADWKAHGRAAGPIRNAQMIAEGKPELVVAFPGGRGTADMVRRARAAGIEVIEVPRRPTGSDPCST